MKKNAILTILTLSLLGSFMFSGTVSPSMTLRFNDIVETTANSGTIAFLNSVESTRDLNVGTKTLLASSAASLFRVISTPLDTCKTTLQVEGKSGLKKIGTKFRNAGGEIYDGKRIPGIPKNLLNFNLSWSNESGAYANLDTTFTGEFYADNVDFHELSTSN